MTPVDEQELATEFAAYADAVKLIEETLRDISGTSITSSGGVIDVLLDLRNYIDQIAESSN